MEATNQPVILSDEQIAEIAELQEIKTRAAKWIQSLPDGVSLDVIAENAALREQLAAMESQRNEALDQCAELHRRLAQVEKGTAADDGYNEGVRSAIATVKSMEPEVQAALDSAATRMRDALVMQVERELRAVETGKLYRTTQGWHSDDIAHALRELIAKLSSVIIEAAANSVPDSEGEGVEDDG